MPTSEHQVDICVVGTGPAGAILGAELSSEGRRVLLLEHGPKLDGLAARGRVNGELAFGDIADQVPAALRQEIVAPMPVAGQAYGNAQVSVVGGSSIRWAAFCPRPVAEDLRVRERFGHGRDWPLDYVELEPWLARAEASLGVAGRAPLPYASPRSTGFPLPRLRPTELETRIVEPAATGLGWRVHGQPAAVCSIPYQGRNACGHCGVCGSCPVGARYSADLVHVPAVENAPSGAVLPLAHVRRLELDRAGRRVVALHAVRSDAPDQAIVVRAGQYVLAAGAIETTRLLLLSHDHRRHRRGIGNHSGLLGRHFTDHAFLVQEFVVRESVGWGAPVFATAMDHFRQPSGRDQRGAFHMIFMPAYNEANLVERALATGFVDVEALRQDVRGSFVALVTAELEGRGEIRLDDEARDPYGDPLARIEVPIGARDEATFAAIDREVDRFAQAVGAVSLHRMRGQEGFVWGAHPMGSCAMAADPDHGVVDTNLRVHGVENLYAVSSASFPHFGSANPTLTIVALALRLAAHLGVPVGGAAPTGTDAGRGIP